MKTSIRIAALMLLIVLSALTSDSGANSFRPPCLCPDVFDPHCDATGATFSNGCVCRCSSTQPNTCTRCGDTLR
jgi:hypothetical protein